MPTKIVEKLESYVIVNQFSLCSKQHPKRDYFKTVEVATRDVSFVDTLDIDDMNLNVSILQLLYLPHWEMR